MHYVVCIFNVLKLSLFLTWTHCGTFHATYDVLQRGNVSTSPKYMSDLMYSTKDHDKLGARMLC